MRQLKPTQAPERAEQLLERYTGPSRGPGRSDRQVKAMLWYYGELVRERRRELKMTQQELAVKVGVRTGLISRVEKGEADIMFSLFIRILTVLGVAIDLQF